MFIVESNPNQEIQIVLRRIKQKLGFVPPHFELYATINPQRFMMFLEEINYISNHKHINPDFFIFLRYHIAKKYNFTYCYKFNEEMLKAKGYSEFESLPLDEKHQQLFSVVMETMETPEEFSALKIENLKELGWSDADIFDALDHGAFLFKFSKILRAYGK